MPEVKFKRIANEINTFNTISYKALKKKEKIGVNHKWSTRRKLREVESFCRSAFKTMEIEENSESNYYVLEKLYNS